VTAEDFQSAYDEWKRQLKMEGKPPLSIAHFAAAICTQQEEQLDQLREMVYKAAGVGQTAEVGHC
jgi:hypothetical protein